MRSADCATEVDLDRGELPPVKTLGVLWCPMEDLFKFQVNQPPERHEHSKRSFLKKIATLFHPLGLLSSYTVRAKVPTSRDMGKWCFLGRTGEQGPLEKGFEVA